MIDITYALQQRAEAAEAELAHVRAQAAAMDEEIGEFQNDVRSLVIELSGAPDDAIDGKGSDAGWQEFTLAEIAQGFAFLKDNPTSRLIPAEKLVAALKKCLYALNYPEEGVEKHEIRQAARDAAAKALMEDAK